MLLGKGRKRLLLVSALSLVGVMAWWLWPQPSAETVLHRGLLCLERQDAECLYGLAEKGDIQAYGLSRDAFVELMNGYVFREGWTRIGNATVRPDPSRSAFQGQIHFAQAGSTVSLGIFADHTGERNEIASPVTSLILSRMPPNKASNPSGQRMLDWIAGDRATLEGYGVLGLNRNDGFMTWDELENRYRNVPRTP